MTTKHDRTVAQERETIQRERVSAEAHHTAQSKHPLLRLQQQVGNAQVARMLAQRANTQEEEEPLQRSTEIQAAPEVGLEGGPISDGLASRIQTMRGGGSPLGDGIRGTMEGALGTDLSDVRVHTGSESAGINRSISAKAFTTGSDVFLGANASTSDTSLMAHELTHVVQQRSMQTSGPMTVGAADDHYEHEANNVASVINRLADESE